MSQQSELTAVAASQPVEVLDSTASENEQPIVEKSQSKGSNKSIIEISPPQAELQEKTSEVNKSIIIENGEKEATQPEEEVKQAEPSAAAVLDDGQAELNQKNTASTVGNNIVNESLRPSTDIIEDMAQSAQTIVIHLRQKKIQEANNKASKSDTPSKIIEIEKIASSRHFVSANQTIQFEEKSKEKVNPFFQIDLPVALQPRKNILREEIVSSHSDLIKRMNQLRVSNKDNQQIILYFIGTKENDTDRSWSSECNALERYINIAKRNVDPSGYFLKVYVGNRQEWADKKNPFKVDPNIRLQQIPTLWVFRTMKRLSGPRLFNLHLLSIMFED